MAVPHFKRAAGWSEESSLELYGSVCGGWPSEGPLSIFATFSTQRFLELKAYVATSTKMEKNSFFFTLKQS